MPQVRGIMTTPRRYYWEISVRARDSWLLWRYKFGATKAEAALIAEILCARNPQEIVRIERLK